jgi:hypothetical protein
VSCYLPRNSFTCLFHRLHYRRLYCLRQYGWSIRLCQSRPPGFPQTLLRFSIPCGVPRCLACLVLATRSVIMRFLFLVTSPPGRLPHLKSDDEVLISRFSHRPALVLCYVDAEVSLLRQSVSCLHSYTSPSIVHPQPAPQAGGRSGMVHTDLLSCPHGCDIRASKYTDEVIPNKRNIFEQFTLIDARSF